MEKKPVAIETVEITPKIRKAEGLLADACIPDHIDDWDQYFLNMAVAAALKSKDASRVGAVIVSEDNIVLSTGFNGLARGVYDDEKILNKKNEKLRVICHAEQNAIINAARIGSHALAGATIYVTKFPCIACLNSVVQAGIKRIYTHDSWFWDRDPFDRNHSRKRSIIRQTHIKVDAPFHPEFTPGTRITVRKKLADVPAISSVIVRYVENDKAQKPRRKK